VNKKVILASTSPRRKELLSSVLWDFDICAPEAEEKDGDCPEATAISNARSKAHSIERKADTIVVACDTVVACDGEILGKPQDAADAKRMLKVLCGRWHEVFSGVCVLADKEYCFAERSAVWIKDLSDSSIDEYIQQYRPFDKAGAYGIQDGVAEDFQGDYNNIVGLPLEKLRKIFMENGIHVKE
jgi:septum formation protein